MSRRSLTFRDHALERYVQRYEPHLPLAFALRKLQDGYRRATKLKKTTRTGDEMWVTEIEGKRVVFVIKYDGRGALCPSVFPEGADQGYVPEKRTSIVSVADPEGEAFKRLYNYVARDAERGLELAARAIEDVEQLVPWRFAGAASENENGQSRDSDGGGAIALLNGTTGTEDKTSTAPRGRSLDAVITSNPDRQRGAGR